MCAAVEPAASKRCTYATKAAAMHGLHRLRINSSTARQVMLVLNVGSCTSPATPVHSFGAARLNRLCVAPAGAAITGRSPNAAVLLVPLTPHCCCALRLLLVQSVTRCRFAVAVPLSLLLLVPAHLQCRQLLTDILVVCYVRLLHVALQVCLQLAEQRVDLQA